MRSGAVCGFEQLQLAEFRTFTANDLGVSQYSSFSVRSNFCDVTMEQQILRWNDLSASLKVDQTTGDFEAQLLEITGGTLR